MSESVESSRPSVDEIYERVRNDAQEELERTPSALAFSALFAGFSIGASILAYAGASTEIPGGAAPFVAALLYPIGYVAVILGRAQLFTENTLYPVLLSIGERRFIGPTVRLWAIVIAANLVGAVLFALLVVETPALPQEVGEEVRRLGVEAVDRGTWTTFWAAILSGWLLALVAWLVESMSTPLGVVVVVVLLTMVVAVVKLDHSIATAIETWGAVIGGDAAFWPTVGWQATTLLGNAIGGVFIVTLVNYGQVRSGAE